MSSKDRTWSNDPYRDKCEDIIAGNLDVIAVLLTAAEVLRSQNERVRALRAGQLPLTTRAKTQSSLLATNEKAAA
jgi:hypothetical protein